MGTGPEDQVCFRVDDVAAGYRATRHLAELGHRVIAHLTGTTELDTPWSPPACRARGYEQALAEVGVAAEAALQIDGSFYVTGARESMTTLLRARPDVTAVFAASDEMAMGAYLAARDLGLRVPHDLSIIGIDGHGLGELINLTTVRQDAYRQGADAALALMAMIDGNITQVSRMYTTELVVRGSTAPPRTA